MTRILATSPGYSATDADTGARLTAAGYEVVVSPRTGNRTPEQLSGLLDGVVGVIASTDPFTAEVFERHPQLRVIARTGVGADSIDLAAASRHGVAVALAPGLNVDSVAEHAIAMILGLAHRIVAQDASVKAGRWERSGGFLPSEIGGKTIGVVGAGAIGRAVIRRLAAFGAEIVYFDPVAGDVPGARRVTDIAALLAEADYVTLHAPLTPDTEHLINATSIAAMKPSAYVINTARGALIDEPALFAALREGRLAGAALDVFDREPPDAAVLAGVPNLICSAHVAGISQESLRRLSVSATTSALAVLNGEMPDVVINRDQLARR